MNATETNVNGIATDGLRQMVEEVVAHPEKAGVGFRVATQWSGGTRSDTRVEGWELGGQRLRRDFRIASDEPAELLGRNTAPNPQELLMAALNACMTVGYVAGCALEGIELELLEIETEGKLDLRGFLGLGPKIPAGYEEVRQTVRIKGNGTPEQFAKVHATVLATSPNYFNLTRPIPVKSRLKVE